MSGQDEETRASQPRRRFELGCGTILLVLLVIAVPLAVRIGQLDRERAAVEAVRQLGGTVLYGRETFVSDALQWLIPARVTSVQLSETRTANADLAPLKALGKLEKLELAHTQITSGGLEPLAGLTRLQSLSLEGTPIGDADLRQLASLKNLTSLRLGGTQVSDAGVGCLETLARLEALDISGTRITGDGLARLALFSRLESVSVDEGQVTAASVANLHAMRSLKRLSIHIPHGTGRRSRDFVEPLGDVNVSACRLVRHAEVAGPSGLRDACLWDNSTQWARSTSGVVEMVLSEVRLGPDESEKLLDVLADAHPDGKWPAPAPRWSGRPPAPVVREGDHIQSTEELLESLKQGDPHSTARALLYARSGAARSAIPALLELLQSPDRTSRYSAAKVLVRVDLTDKRVSAAIAGMLKDNDPIERVMTVDALNDTQVHWVYGDAIPGLSPASAKTAIPLLVEASRDPSKQVRSDAAVALGSLVRADAQGAKLIVPALLDMLKEREWQVRNSVGYALKGVVQADPKQTKVITPALLDALRDTHEGPRDNLIEALGCAAQSDAEAAHAAVPTLLGLLQGENPMETQATADVLCRIVQSQPEQIRQIVPAALRTSQDADGRIRSAACRALASAAAGICERNAQLRAGQKP